MVGLDQLVVAGRQAATKSQCGQISDVVARLACGRKPPGAMNGAAVWLSSSWLVGSSLLWQAPTKVDPHSHIGVRKSELRGDYHKQVSFSRTKLEPLR